MLLWTWRGSVAVVVLAMAVLVGNLQLPADDAPAQPPADPADPATTPAPPNPATQPSKAEPSKNEPSKNGLRKLAKDHDIWVDVKRRLVVVDGKVCLREGQLEMFACPQGTKEHESIVSVNCPAQYVHGALLAIGAKAGHPVQFDPKYVPAAGTEVDILVLWKDEDGKNHKVRAQEWIKYAKTGKEMPFPWVFAGSGHWTEESTGKVYYYGDDGDFICVSNFPTATLDLPVESSQANGDLLFTAFTKRIPPKDTKVRLVLIPKLAKKKPAAEPQDAKPKAGEKSAETSGKEKAKN